MSTDIEYKNSNPKFAQVLKIPFVVSLITKRSAVCVLFYFLSLFLAVDAFLVL